MVVGLLEAGAVVAGGGEAATSAVGGVVDGVAGGVAGGVVVGAAAIGAVMAGLVAGGGAGRVGGAVTRIGAGLGLDAGIDEGAVGAAAGAAVGAAVGEGAMVEVANGTIGIVSRAGTIVSVARSGVIVVVGPLLSLPIRMPIGAAASAGGVVFDGAVRSSSDAWELHPARSKNDEYRTTASDARRFMRLPRW